MLLGIVTGLLFFMIYVSQAWSYASDNPQTCINCHVMYPQYASWAHSSHARSANCNDCHVPHTDFVSKYLFKASDGLRHATIFTMRGEKQVIQIKQAGIDVVQQNCIRCHYDMVSMIDIVEVTGENAKEGRGHRCWDCHREVPHGTVNSLSSFPHSVVPLLPSVMPDWLKAYNAKNKDKHKMK
jgi:cytochrome c nitrite reductase small subunit